MKYNFYGWEQADVHPVNDEYSKISDPRALYDLLSEIWCANTCAPRMREGWTKDNMTLGQCSITAFLAQDIFGGKVFGILRAGGNYHCYNVIGDCIFDLTSEQFGDEKLCYENNPEQFREVHFSKEEKRLRYEYLKNELRRKLSDRFSAAYDFAAKKHNGQYRKGGEPYITHPAAVAEMLREQGYSEDFRIAALFHDLLEDTDATEEEIKILGGEEVLEAVRLLTKRKGYVMSEYIAGIKRNPMAFAVKAADRLHNLRSAFVTDEDFKRRYILESIEWYLDFSPDIPKAVKALSDSLDTPISDNRFDLHDIDPDEDM